MMEMVAHKTKSREGLLQISGMGINEAEKFGDQF
jgi:hypothetical protein